MSDFHKGGRSQQSYCSYCGHPVEVESRFCAYCGKEIIYQQVNFHQTSREQVRQTDYMRKMQLVRNAVSKAAGQVVCVILMILLGIKLIANIISLIVTTSSLNRIVSMYDYNREISEVMNFISAVIIIIGLFGMIPYILEVIGTFTAVIGGLRNQIKSTGFTLINVGLTLSLIGSIIISVTGLLAVIGIGGAINNQITRYGDEGIVPYIIAIVICLVAYLVLIIFFYIGLMRPGSCAKQMLTYGAGEIKLSIFSIVILCLNVVVKIIGMIGSIVFDPSRMLNEFIGNTGLMNSEASQLFLFLSAYLRNINVKQMIITGVDILVLIFVIASMIMFKNRCKTDIYIN